MEYQHRMEKILEDMTDEDTVPPNMRSFSLLEGLTPTSKMFTLLKRIMVSGWHTDHRRQLHMVINDTLKEWQIQLMAEILASRTPIAATAPLRHPINGYFLGTLVVPAHVEEGVDVPERRHKIRYSPGYGVCADSLCTSNGSARLIVQCVWEGSYFEPLSPLVPAHLEAEFPRIREVEAQWAQITP